MIPSKRRLKKELCKTSSYFIDQGETKQCDTVECVSVHVPINGLATSEMRKEPLSYRHCEHYRLEQTKWLYHGRTHGKVLYHGRSQDSPESPQRLSPPLTSLSVHCSLWIEHLPFCKFAFWSLTTDERVREKFTINTFLSGRNSKQLC